MEPEIEKVKFGSIRIAGQTYKHDVVISLDGKVRKRKKKLSKAIYGTSHIISLDEIKHVYKTGSAPDIGKPEVLIIGTGQFDRVRLSDQARSYLDALDVQVVMAAVPKAIRDWNKAQGKVIGLFHITC